MDYSSALFALREFSTNNKLACRLARELCAVVRRTETAHLLRWSHEYGFHFTVNFAGDALHLFRLSPSDMGNAEITAGEIHYLAADMSERAASMAELLEESLATRAGY